MQFKELIDRYLAGTASTEEIEQLNALEQSFPQIDIQSIHTTSVKPDILKKWIYRKIAGSIFKKRSLRWIGAAAAVAALLLVVWLPKGKPLNNSNKEIVYHQVKTSAGKIKEVHLSDGSIVTLNAGSTLAYPDRFANNLREVELVGQAFFKVKHNTHQPFLVHAGSLTTRVLGTSFDVYAYPEAHEVRITLATGRINVANSKTDLATLTPNHQLVLNKANNSTQTLAVKASDYTSWKTGQQFFKQSSLEEVGLYLNKWYGITLSFKQKSLKNYRITTSFTASMPVKQVLEIITASSCAQYTMHQKNVVLSGSGCQPITHKTNH